MGVLLQVRTPARQRATAGRSKVPLQGGRAPPRRVLVQGVQGNRKLVLQCRANPASRREEPASAYLSWY